MKNRIYILFFSFFLLAFIILASIVIVKINEFYKQTEIPTEAVVKAGYQRFRKAVNGFNFKYPTGWVYKPEISTDDFINGTFSNQDNSISIYLEAPFVGRNFSLKTINRQEYFSDNTLGINNYYPVIVVSSTILQTNETESPLAVKIYGKCDYSSTSTVCFQISKPDFIVAHWQRGAHPASLDINFPSNQNGSFFLKLSEDETSLENELKQFRSVVETLRFNDLGEWSAFNSLGMYSYHDLKLNYSFNYRSDYKLSANSDLSFISMSTGTLLEYPEEFTTGTNLSEAKIAFGEPVGNVNQNDCLPEFGVSTPPETAIINGITFKKIIGADAGLGNRYDTINYGTNYNGRCFDVVLYLHSTVRENYPEEIRPREYNKDQIIGNFYKVLNTILLK